MARLARVITLTALFGVFGVTSHEWKPEHKAQWESNIGLTPRPHLGLLAGRSPSHSVAPKGAAHGAPREAPRGARGALSKRQAAVYIPGSKVPVHYYPNDRTVYSPDQVPSPASNDRFQYLDGASTQVNPRSVDVKGNPVGGHGRGKGRRRKEGRRLRHQQHHQHQRKNQLDAVAPSDGPSTFTDTRPAPGGVFYRTVQRGSARVPYPPPNAKTPVIPVHPDPARTSHSLITHLDSAADQPYSLSPPACPTDQMVMAPKGQDYVIMKQITASDGTPLDVIAGPQSGDPAPEGAHPIVGRLLGPDTPTSRGQRRSRLCRLTYTVLVRHCPPAPEGPADVAPGLTPRCTSGTAWGSRCHYRCARRDMQLRGRAWLECGDDLEWIGKPPTCVARHSCSVPPVPEHGVLSCRADDSDHNEVRTMAEGSECTVSCKAPRRLQGQGSNGTMRCVHGRWDAPDWTCVMMEDGDLDDDMEDEIPAVLSDAAGQDSGISEIKDNSLMADPCSPNPCHFGGTCLRGPLHQAVLCMCPADREGDRCERIRCRGPCHNGGRCILVRGTPSCYCRPGYRGNHCQAPVKRVSYRRITETPRP